MVDNSIGQIIAESLAGYLEEESIGFSPSNRFLQYIIRLKEYEIEICYEFVDNFYRIKIESKKNNILGNVVFLTKSKNYHKEIKKQLKDNKLSGELFENHMLCFVRILKQNLDMCGNLDLFNKVYIHNLKFDGIFMQ